jgi:hypothetical protein
MAAVFEGRQGVLTNGLTVHAHVADRDDHVEVSMPHRHEHLSFWACENGARTQHR